jgi:hypothetical protein
MVVDNFYLSAHFVFLSVSFAYAREVPDWVGYAILAIAAFGVSVLGLSLYLILRKKK